MSIDELYRELILDHHRHPRNAGPLPGANAQAEGFNPLCGDHFVVRVATDGERLRAVRFEGTGCAISTASASLMATQVEGRTRGEALALFERVHRMLRGESRAAEDDLDSLASLAGVSAFPLRVKCATLPWHTLRAALEGRQSASTEGP